MALKRRTVVRLDDETMEMLKDKAGKEKMEVFIKHMVKTYEKGTYRRPRFRITVQLRHKIEKEAGKNESTDQLMMFLACQYFFDLDEKERRRYIHGCSQTHLGFSYNTPE